MHDKDCWMLFSLLLPLIRFSTQALRLIGERESRINDLPIKTWTIFKRYANRLNSDMTDKKDNRSTLAIEIKALVQIIFSIKIIIFAARECDDVKRDIRGHEHSNGTSGGSKPSTAACSQVPTRPAATHDTYDRPHARRWVRYAPLRFTLTIICLR